MNSNFESLKRWLANALEFTLGNPNGESHVPPSIGVQPYSDKPLKAH